ncbi:MAG: hypothetical protein ACLFSQ_09385 [Candidatus Zixiibacteriota bacterium]
MADFNTVANDERLIDKDYDSSDEFGKNISNCKAKRQTCSSKERKKMLGFREQYPYYDKYSCEPQKYPKDWQK